MLDVLTSPALMRVTQLETVDKTGRYFTDSTFSTAHPQDLLFHRAGERNGPEVVTCCSPPPSLPPAILSLVSE